jgi:electron transport complex protein RnfB
VAKCPAQAIDWNGTTITIDHDKCLAYGPDCMEVCVDICPSVILHRVGQRPRPEPAEPLTPAIPATPDPAAVVAAAEAT